MALQLRKASKKQVKLKLALTGASGSGKTMSALRMAYGIVGDWNKIAVIDSENNSSELYSGFQDRTEKIEIGEFNVIEFTPPFNPNRLIEAIHVCEDAGIEVIIIDSLSHFWNKEGGILEIAGANFKNWKAAGELEKKLWDCILQSKTHVVGCMRTKAAYEVENVDKGNGKTGMEVKKIGTKPVQRDDFEFEFTVVLNLDSDNTYKSLKDRTGLFRYRVGEKITEDTGKQLLAWADAGEDESEVLKAAYQEIEKAKTVDELTGIYNKYFSRLTNGRQAEFKNELSAKRKEIESKAKTTETEKV